MKKIFNYFALFIVLNLAISGLTSCKNSSTSESGDTTASAQTKDKGQFPPLPEKIAAADIKMIDGSSFKLADKKGKVVLVNLWATWCSPCRAEMPELVEMHTKYADKGFEVIGLDTDQGETVDQIQAFAKEMNLNYPLGYADDEMFRQFVRISGLQGIPQSILVNREGKMTGVFAGGNPETIKKMAQTVEKTVNAD